MEKYKIVLCLIIHGKHSNFGKKKSGKKPQTYPVCVCVADFVY